MRSELDMGEWAELAREEVEELATAYWLTIEKVRILADEKYPDDRHESEQLFRRASQNVRAALFKDLADRGCPPNELDSWVATILQEAERLRSDGDSGA